MTKPIITINSPTPNQSCGLDAPSFDIEINEPNLHEKWYSLNGGQNITFTNQTQIDQAEWDKIEEGSILITFYAIDTVGNMGLTSVFVTKSIPSNPAIPGYNLFLLIGSIAVVLLIRLVIINQKNRVNKQVI